MSTAVEKIRNHPFAGDVLVYKWVLEANETGDKIDVPRHSDKTVHIFGDFGGTVTIEGGCDPTGTANFVTLEDNLGNDLSFTSADIKLVGPNAYKIGPKAGAGVSNTTVFIMVR